MIVGDCLGSNGSRQALTDSNRQPAWRLACQHRKHQPGKHRCLYIRSRQRRLTVNSSVRTRVLTAAQHINREPRGFVYALGPKTAITVSSFKLMSCIISNNFCCNRRWLLIVVRMPVTVYYELLSIEYCTAGKKCRVYFISVHLFTNGF